MTKLYVVELCVSTGSNLFEHKVVSSEYFAKLEDAKCYANEAKGSWDSICIHEMIPNNRGMFIYNKSFTF